ncbi:MAG: Na+/H+ antiporter NhaA [Planctomycetales bacterium]|nr:Na+/H+ antiporter NhaA [Planctomycetales bacterium]
MLSTLGPGMDPDQPPQKIDRIVESLRRFLHIEAASGVVLMVCTCIAITAANSPWADAYLNFWKIELGISFGDYEFRHSLKHWINDGLMAIFFFVIGLEVKREIVLGDLSNLRKASLPIAAALGGMIVPAAVYLLFHWGQPTMRGWGVPMATDIAFVVGCMALIGSRVPHSLRILLLSLAIVDDIGAILVIAIGYTEDLSWNWLLVAAAGIGLVHMCARVGIRRFPVYFATGMIVWFAFHESGVHATIAGVILGLMAPAQAFIRPGRFRELLHRIGQVFEGNGWESSHGRAETVRRFQHLTRETVSPIEYLLNRLHPWTSFVIMSLFALANAGVPLQLEDLSHPISLAIVCGLVFGKPLGIILFSWVAVRLGLAQLPSNINWSILFAAGCLAGIGFTMSLFIAGLAFGSDVLDTAKVGVLVGSAASAALGITFLLWTLPRKA